MSDFEDCDVCGATGFWNWECGFCGALLCDKCATACHFADHCELCETMDDDEDDEV